MANNNNTKNLNVPNLRFPEFKGEWEETTLGKCVIQPLDYGMNTAAITYDGENKYIRITDIDEQSSQYISDSPVSPAGQLLDKYIVEENDILFARTGASTGKTYLYKKKDGKLYFAGFLIRAKIKTECNSTFIFAQTKTVRYYKWVGFMSIRSGQPGINSQEYASYRFLIPQKEEQDKIAKFLSLLDSRIEAQIKIIEDLKKLKSAVITVIFTTTNGVNYQLKDLAKFIGGGTPSSNDSSYWSGDIPWISSSDVSEDNINKITITRHITNEAIKKSATQICESPCILIVSRVGVGKVALSNISLCTSQDFCNLTKIKCNPKFLAYQLQSIMKRKSYAVQGTSIKGITTEEIKKTGIMLPSIEKQLSIASTLSRIDTFIDVEISILENYQKLRKYLLQQMFI
ncbi:restriction endonuclease subunit S [Bacteroides ovatus]|jgi:type I restriction-modification system, S subunit|uniref:restriction endonuclease subunit S n=3 Tax=Bacteroides TaxID=816 RepID=UPI00216607D2|nr:restriction endonuclease subunit S [Bacteroides ovatus]MCS2638115.1 restriction endonuclease subunit S [Bacteroides ovatus]